jgi:26S proteasome regulatory subunit N7
MYSLPGAWKKPKRAYSDSLSSLGSFYLGFRLIDEGGDWDRRNRLKVYHGLHLVSIRQFKKAGEQLLDALSTFTATELVSYNDFVALTVIAGTLTLSRVDLKKKVCLYSVIFPPQRAPLLRLQLRLIHSLLWQIIGAPEVIQVLPELPELGDLVRNLYDCHYDKFFRALGELSPYSLYLLRADWHCHAI